MPPMKRTREDRTGSAFSEGGSDVVRPGKKPRMAEGLPDDEAVFEESVLAARTLKSKQGIDYSLRPMTEFPDMVRDLVAGASPLLTQAVTEPYKSKTVTVATMCSGTEAPLLALLMLQECLALYNLFLNFIHLFSAEISPSKQAFIERNFEPNAIFTDVRDLAQGAEALTAYGGYQKVPGGVSFLVAGFSCVDFSTLNPRPKGVEACGESGDTLRAILHYARRHRPRAMILENVQTAKWHDIEALVNNNPDSTKTNLSDAARSHLKQIWGDELGYSTMVCKVDTKDYYLPQTRNRGYMICIDRREIGTERADGIAKRWSQLLRRFRRPASSPMDDFLLPADDERVRIARDNGGLNEYGERRRRTESTWVKCKLRYANQRDASDVGNMRPLTHWVEGGACHLPEHWFREWAHLQPDRLREHWDISHLRCAQLGYDSRYKTRMWELSQNIDRTPETSPWGIAQCMTPTGQPFYTTRGGLATPTECLILQGLPMDKLDLGRLNNKEVQDLAGNAMSTTVVAATILALLIAAPDELTSFLPPCEEDVTGQETHIDMIDSNLTEFQPLALTITAPMALSDLISGAKSSARLCLCESPNSNTESQISQCKDCGHTSCAKCSSAVYHHYNPLTNLIRTSPVVFAQQLKDALPMRLHITGRPIPPSLYHHTDRTDELAMMVVSLNRLPMEEFRFFKISRSHCWTVRFEGRSLTLKLTIYHGEATWQLFIKPGKRVAGNARIRRIARHPIARMTLGNEPHDLCAGSWAVTVPDRHHFAISISTGNYSWEASWQAKIGLPQYQGQRVCQKLDISVLLSQLHKSHPVASLTGTYELFSRCETATASLYKKTEPENDGSHIYFFLDPYHFVDQKYDRYVFAKTHHRLAHREVREVIARLVLPFRPTAPSGIWRCTAQGESIPCDWKLQAPGDIQPIRYCAMKDGSHIQIPDGIVSPEGSRSYSAKSKVKQNLKASSSHSKRPLKTLHSFSPGTVASSSSAVGPPEAVLSIPVFDCNSSHMILTSMVVPLDTFDMETWHTGSISRSKQQLLARQLGWVTARLQLHNKFSDDWMEFSVPSSPHTCQKCAPSLPAIRWARSVSGSKITPYEDEAQAAVFERAIKSRLPVLICDLKDVKDGAHGRIDIGVNWASLSHRAMGKLPHQLSDKVRLEGRIQTLEQDGLYNELPKFTLLPSRMRSPAEYVFPTGMTLRPEQLRALYEMLDQETEDALPLFAEEAREEALLPEHRLRVHVLFRKDGVFLGGVLAHEVGFGKTAIVLALIDLTRGDPAITPAITPAGSIDMEGKIASKATLILVPPTILEQWGIEIERFLGKGNYKVVFIKDVTSLKNTTVGTIQEADIIIVSYKLFQSLIYRDGIAALGNLPAQLKVNGRLFQEWYDRAAMNMKTNIEDMKANGLDGMAAQLRDKFVTTALDPQLVKPVSSTRLRGRAYAEDAKEREKKNEKALQQNEEDPDAPQLDGDEAGELQGKADEGEEAGEEDQGGQEEEAEKSLEEKTQKAQKEAERLQARFQFEGDPKAKSKAKAKEFVSELNNPILHMFHFPRLVIDEVTYVDDAGHILINGLHASRRWVLSGTPKLGDFMDVKNLAQFLGFNLGEDDDTPGVMKAYNVQKLRRQRTKAEEFRSLTQVRSMDFHRDRWEHAQKWLDRFARQDQADIDEIPVITHYVGIQLTSTERALELEMYQIVDETGIATKAPRGPTSKLPDDKVDRVRQNSKDCRNAVEVLLLYTCLFEWPATPGASSPSEAMSFRRKMQYKALTTRITWVMRKALHLHGRLIEDIPEFDASSPWGKWLKEMGDGESIFSAPVHQKIFGIMQGLKYDADDKVMFMRHPTSKAINEERVKELMIPVPLLDRKADPRVDDIPTWDTSAYQEALQSTVAHGRRLAIEMESRFREIRFMKALRNCQAWVANPNAPAAVRTCSKCRIPCTDPRNTRVVGPCGHMFCRDCFNDIPETRGLCTMENCDAVMVPNSQYTAQLLGTDDGDPVKQAHGAKVGEIVKLVHNTLAGEQVLLFVQFDKIMKPISKALEDQGISNYALHDGNKATHAKKMLAFQNEKMPTAKKVLILNATKDVAAGANLTNANHVIFMSTFWADTHHSYHQSMTQCIGRARRYGQRRTVHVYRLVALDTVDVDVLEWREGKKLVRRADKTFTLKDESELSAEEEAENLGTGFLKKNGYYERGE